MNLRQTAEVSAIVATSAAHIVESPHPVPTESLHGYWKQSRMRLKCWFAGLRASRSTPPGESSVRTQPQLVSLAREILVTEMLTRVWSTVLIATDHRQQANHAAATARNSFEGHLDARREVLRLMADDDILTTHDQVSLDRFRRRIERWTDALLGPLLANYGIAEFAFDELRARDFATSALQETLTGAANAYAPLLIAGVTAAFPVESDADRERAMLNLAIVRSILAAFPKDAFPSRGQCESVVAHSARRPGGDPEAPPVSASGPQDCLGKGSAAGLSFREIRLRELRGRPSSD